MSTATSSASPPVGHDRGARSDRLAGRLALAGASLGVLAGLLELTVGPSVREWVGDKQDTTRLGLTTVVLSAIALVAAVALTRPHGDVAGRRVAIALAYVFLGATALGVAGVLGILGGALIWAAARTAPRSPRVAYALLLCGALPFAAATWWSVITPIVAVLAVVIGRGVIRHATP